MAFVTASSTSNSEICIVVGSDEEEDELVQNVVDCVWDAMLNQEAAEEQGEPSPPSEPESEEEAAMAEAMEEEVLRNPESREQRNRDWWKYFEAKYGGKGATCKEPKPGHKRQFPESDDDEEGCGASAVHVSVAINGIQSAVIG